MGSVEASTLHVTVEFTGVKMMTDTVGVEYTVRGVERVHNRGSLIGLAVVEIEIAGVAITLQGVQVICTATGRHECRAPVFRHPASGTWLPGVVMPPELSSALAAEVLEAWDAL